MPSASSRRSRTWTSKRRATSCENFSGPDCSADSKSASAAQDTHGPGGPTVWVPESPRGTGPASRQPSGNEQQGAPMKIIVTSVMVDDQEKALRFYTEVLGFSK